MQGGGRFNQGRDVTLLNGGEFSNEGTTFSAQTSLPGRFYFSKGRQGDLMTEKQET